jgi:hypothetical protein
MLRFNPREVRLSLRELGDELVTRRESWAFRRLFVARRFHFKVSSAIERWIANERHGAQGERIADRWFKIAEENRLNARR